MSGSDLVAFVQAQLRIDEQRIQNNMIDSAHTMGCGYDLIEFSPTDCKCGVPKRLMAEIATKRAILALHALTAIQFSPNDPQMPPFPMMFRDLQWFDAFDRPIDPAILAEYGRKACGQCSGAWPCLTVMLLAQPFADRPGWRAEWAVQA